MLNQRHKTNCSLCICRTRNCWAVELVCEMSVYKFCVWFLLTWLAAPSVSLWSRRHSIIRKYNCCIYDFRTCRPVSYFVQFAGYLFFSFSFWNIFLCSIFWVTSCVVWLGLWALSFRPHWMHDINNPRHLSHCHASLYANKVERIKILLQVETRTLGDPRKTVLDAKLKFINNSTINSWTVFESSVNTIVVHPNHSCFSVILTVYKFLLFM